MSDLTGASDLGAAAIASVLTIGGADLALGLLAGAAGAAATAAAIGLRPGAGRGRALGGALGWILDTVRGGVRGGVPGWAREGRMRDRNGSRAPGSDTRTDADADTDAGARTVPASGPRPSFRDAGASPARQVAAGGSGRDARPAPAGRGGPDRRVGWPARLRAALSRPAFAATDAAPHPALALPFRIDDGILRPLSRAARRRPGGRDGGGAPHDIAAFAAGFSVVEGPADLVAALTLLETEGIGFQALVDDAQGEVWELTGAPRSGEARVDLVPGSAARREAARLRAELRAAEAERDAALSVLDAAPVMAWRRDAAGRVVWGNALYRRLSGASEAQAAAARRLGRDPGAPALPELRGDLGGPEPRAAGARTPPDGGAPETTGPGAGAGAVPDPGERVDDRDGRAAVFDAHSGERRWFEISSRAGGEGEDLRFAVDAAPAVHAEGALRRFVETLTETFAHIRIGLAIFDRERRLGLFNPAFAELMRLDPAWLAARPDLPAVLAQLRESRRLPDHEDFGQWRRGILGLFGEGEGDALRGPRPERTEIWHLPGEEQIRMVARPHPQGAVAFLFEDVTETARLERRFLTETETRRAVMDRLEEGVVAFGPDGVARFANPAFAAMWGFRPGADGDGLRLADALARFRARSAGREVWDRLAGFFAAAGARSAWSDEVALTDGRRLRARVAALPDGSVLVAFLDVTDALRAEAAMRDRSAALEAAEEIRSALIEQVSLRMRTPLARVSGLTQRLRDGASDGDADAGGWGTGGGASRGGVSGGGMSGGGASRPAGFGEDGVNSGGGAVDGVLGPRQLALLDGVLEAAAQMQEALTGVADLASAQAGVLAMSPEPVNLRAALASALDVARRRAQARGVALSLEADEALDASQAVTGDAQRLRQLLFNLVADAVHRAPAGGWVRAGARRLGERVEVWTDEPAPEAVAEGRTEAEAAVRGGLAHALVRRFAELHDGGVRVELVRRGAPAMSPDALDGEEVGPRGDRLHVICSLPLTALRPTTATEAEALRAESA